MDLALPTSSRTPLWQLSLLPSYVPPCLNPLDLSYHYPKYSNLKINLLCFLHPTACSLHFFLSLMASLSVVYAYFLYLTFLKHTVIRFLLSPLNKVIFVFTSDLCVTKSNGCFSVHLLFSLFTVFNSVSLLETNFFSTKLLDPTLSILLLSLYHSKTPFLTHPYMNWGLCLATNKRVHR